MKLKETKHSLITKAAIVLRPKNTPELSDILPNLVQWLHRRGVDSYFFEYEHERVENILRKSLPKNVHLIDRKMSHADVDLFITLGGDGTLIGIGRECTKVSPPIFGINLGNLGFITEFSKLDFYDYLDGVIKGNYEVIKVSQFKAQVYRKNELRFKGYFLNDAVVNKNDISRLFSLSLFSGEEHIYDLSGDGLILSTPVGSTAYSLAAGGPIIHPNVDSLVITPICPHSLTHRPLVVAGTTDLKIKLKDQNGAALLTLDGQEVISISFDDTLLIQKEERRSLKLVLNPDKAYFQTLKSKLTHGRK
jgi:NAD+ kinase